MLEKTERTLVLLNSAAPRWLRTNRCLSNAFTQISIVRVKMCSNGCLILSTKLRAVLCSGECVCYSVMQRFTQMEPAPHTPQLCVVISITSTYLVWTSEYIIHRTHSAPSCAMSPITDQQSHVYGFLNTASLCPADMTRERSSRPAGDKIPACRCEAWGKNRKCCCDGRQSQIGLLLWRDTHADSLGKNTWLHPEPWVRPDGKQVQTAANMSLAQRGQCHCKKQQPV